jgi:hypothetical protein
METVVALPPGLEVPGLGDAGPSNWVDRGWAEHERQSAELALQAQYRARVEERQRDAISAAGRERRSRCRRKRREREISKSPPDSAGTHVRAWDYGADKKWRLLRHDTDGDDNDDDDDDEIGVNGNEMDGLRQSSGQGDTGACLTRLTLGD